MESDSDHCELLPNSYHRQKISIGLTGWSFWILTSLIVVLVVSNIASLMHISKIGQAYPISSGDDLLNNTF